MKNVLMTVVFILICSFGFAQTTLTPGDIAFTGVNMDNDGDGNDQFSIVFLVDIENGTTIKFTDNGWKSDDTWRSNEGVITWEASQAYSKGDEIVITEDNSNFALSGSGDQIIAYQNDSDMIAALNDEGNHVWQSDATNSNTSALPKDLENGTTCVALQEIDNIKYDRSVISGTKEELLNAINDYNNWSGSDSDRQVLSTDGFTVDETLPVELSSFSAVQLDGNTVSIQWITQSEAELIGYNIFKNTINNRQSSSKINAILINANNSNIETNYNFEDDNIESETKYYYWLESIDLSGGTNYFGPVIFELSFSDYPDNEQPDFGNITKLNGNYPNPFNPQTTISFTLSESEFTEINIYNIRGELVKKLYHQIANGGTNSVNWDGRDDYNKQVTSGLYFYKMQTNNFEEIKKMLLMK